MKNPTNLFRTFAWAWIIMTGVLMITPGGVYCIACGPIVSPIMGVISILIGISGLVVDRRQSSVSG